MKVLKKRKILTLSAVFLTAAALFACVLFLADTPPKCNVKMPILMYHDLTLYPEECDDMTITAKRMENDLKWLAENNYTAILPRELNTLIEAKKLTSAANLMS